MSLLLIAYDFNIPPKYKLKNVIKKIFKTTFNNGSLGSRIDEERSELRYVM